MKPLHVGLIVKNTAVAFEREKRNMGLFSYETPYFTWEHIKLAQLCVWWKLHRAQYDDITWQRANAGMPW